MSDRSLLDKETRTPFWIDLENTNVGHTMTVGPTGAGKSALLNDHLQALLAQQYDASNQAGSIQTEATTSEPQGEGE